MRVEGSPRPETGPSTHTPCAISATSRKAYTHLRDLGANKRHRDKVSSGVTLWGRRYGPQTPGSWWERTHGVQLKGPRAGREEQKKADQERMEARIRRRRGDTAAAERSILPELVTG